jgi:NADPH2:quinone reductase
MVLSAVGSDTEPRTEMTQVIRIHESGGPEVMIWEDVTLNAPAAGEVQIRHAAVGVNYIDIYHRKGDYPLPLPSGLGVEGAGTVVAVGEGVDNFKEGDRVAYVGGPPGAYAQERMVPAGRILRLPDSVSFEVAASLAFKGLTVEYLIRRCYAVKPGDVVLFHAAAGGVGTIAMQWLKQLGATVIGTVSSDAKAAHARENGCDHTIDYKRENVVKRVKELTDGAGVAVVYDSIGKDTFAQSLQSLRARGMLVSFGIVSGPTPPVDLAELGAKGSLFVTRASIANYTAKRDELEAAAASLFEMIASGKIKAGKSTSFGLRDVVQAHRELEGGKTSGSVILLP